MSPHAPGSLGAFCNESPDNEGHGSQRRSWGKTTEDAPFMARVCLQPQIAPVDMELLLPKITIRIGKEPLEPRLTGSLEPEELQIIQFVHSWYRGQTRFSFPTSGISGEIKTNLPFSQGTRIQRSINSEVFGNKAGRELPALYPPPLYRRDHGNRKGPRWRNEPPLLPRKRTAKAARQFYPHIHGAPTAKGVATIQARNSPAF